MEDKYKDSNLDENTISSLKVSLDECFNTEDVLAVLNTHLPDWIIGHSTRFGKTLGKFQKNWEKVCNIIGCEKNLIFIVEFSPASVENPQHTTILNVCNILTKYGNLVRDYHDFELCDECECVKLTKEASLKLKKDYNKVCVRCLPQMIHPN